ncbi:hypothetical protein [Acrocarpospora sp. B8E8]|uniref:hypothetical protein n=1 Tax=Acrocarpospora sp. B8E8 TaxID=3153572 RepID=UPI00325CDAAF
MKTTRMLAAAATTVALGLSVLTASPAEAAVTRSFSESASEGSASWGTVTFNSYSWNVDAYIYRDSSASIKLEVCGWQSLSNGSWGLLGCKSATNGGSIGSTRHVTTLGGSASWARVSMVSTDLYVNGVFADGDWNYGF